MERVIKFRLWDIEHKRFLPVEGNCAIFPNGKLYCLNGNVLILKDYVVAQQFTGVKDIEGKEIYEGDIVKVDYSDNYGIGRIECIEGGGFCIVSKHGAAFLDSVSTMKHSKIIGNFFDNADLLK